MFPVVFLPFILHCTANFLFCCTTNCSLWVLTKSALQFTDSGVIILAKCMWCTPSTLVAFFVFHHYFFLFSILKIKFIKLNNGTAVSLKIHLKSISESSTMFLVNTCNWRNWSWSKCWQIIKCFRQNHLTHFQKHQTKTAGAFLFVTSLLCH